MADQRLKVVFSVPIDGWITLDLETQDTQVSIPISYTPNDFLSDFLTALILARDGIDGSALANAEPSVTEFALAPTPNKSELILRVTEYPGWKRRSRQGRQLFAIQGAVEDLIVPFWRAVRRLQASVAPEEYHEAMRREFPGGKVGRLSEILRKG